VPVSREDLEVECLSSIDSIRASEWDLLVERCADATVFQGYGWNRSWWETFAGADDVLHLITVRCDRTLVGLAPLYRTASDAECLRFLGEQHADYLGFLVDDDVGAIVLDLLLESLFANGAPWEVVHLEQIRETSALFSRLNVGGARRSRHAVRIERTPCPGVTLVGRASEARRLVEKKSLKRHAAALARRGTVSVEHLELREDVARLLPAFFEQHLDRWAVTATPSLFGDRRNRDFYCRLASSLCDSRAIVLSVVRCGVHNVAYHFGLRSKNSLIWYKPAFDIRWHQLSPGEVLMRELLSLALVRGFDEFDFTRGDEAFKLRFADHVDYNSSFVLYRSAWRYSRAAVRRRAKQALRRVADWTLGESLVTAALGLFRRAGANRRSRTAAFAAVAKALGAAAAGQVYKSRRLDVFLCDRASQQPGTIDRNVISAELGFLLRIDAFVDAQQREERLRVAFERSKRGDRCFVLLEDGRAVAYGWATELTRTGFHQGGQPAAPAEGVVCLYDVGTFGLDRGREYYTRLLIGIRAHFLNRNLVLQCETLDPRTAEAVADAGFRLVESRRSYTVLGVRRSRSVIL
jgi:CelD/BcsL family acetyltransferase involved in cellulose biosynthesis